MHKVVLDAELRAKLNGGAAKVTFTDENGKAVGHYIPDDLYQGILDALVPAGEGDREAAREEMRRGEVVTTAELLAGLQEACRRWEGQP
jgi:hypothetical protein